MGWGKGIGNFGNLKLMSQSVIHQMSSPGCLAFSVLFRDVLTFSHIVKMQLERALGSWTEIRRNEKLAGTELGSCI